MPRKGPPFPSSASESGSSEAAASSEEEQPQQQKQTPVEEEEEGSSGGSGSSPKPSAKPDMPKPKAPATSAASGSSSSSSSSSSSDPDSKPQRPPRRVSRGPDPSIKPITSKPMDATSKSSKPSGAEKRKRKQSEAPEEDESAAANDLAGKKLFQRVWTDDDEIVILKGMIHAKSHGEEPESAIDNFLKVIRKSLHSEFTKTQLADKIRRLRKKYETNQRRRKKGADPSFAKTHDQAVFELSKKVWGGEVVRDFGDDVMEVENVGKGGAKEARRKSVSAPVVASQGKGAVGSESVRGGSLALDGEGGEGRARAVYPKLRDAVTLLEGENGGGLLGRSLSEALDLLKPETAKVLEERWSRHFLAGLKYFLERSELKEELLKYLVEAIEKA